MLFEHWQAVSSKTARAPYRRARADSFHWQWELQAPCWCCRRAWPPACQCGGLSDMSESKPGTRRRWPTRSLVWCHWHHDDYSAGRREDGSASDRLGDSGMALPVVLRSRRQSGARGASSTRSLSGSGLGGRSGQLGPALRQELPGPGLTEDRDITWLPVSTSCAT